ncbi:MAG TPA: hypothetical protein VII33_14030 [Nakamurella sp.]
MTTTRPPPLGPGAGAGASCGAGAGAGAGAGCAEGSNDWAGSAVITGSGSGAGSELEVAGSDDTVGGAVGTSELLGSALDSPGTVTGGPDDTGGVDDVVAVLLGGDA